MLSTGNMNESWFNNSTYVSELEVVNKNFSIVQVLGLMLLALLVIFIISGNVLVICTFLSVARNLRTITNYFVVSLAVSDILVGSFSVPFWMWVKISKLLNTINCGLIYLPCFHTFYGNYNKLVFTRFIILHVRLISIYLILSKFLQVKSYLILLRLDSLEEKWFFMEFYLFFLCVRFSKV